MWYDAAHREVQSWATHHNVEMIRDGHTCPSEVRGWSIRRGWTNRR